MYKLVLIIGGIIDYEIIWGMDFLPNGDLIFGEKKGKLHIINQLDSLERNIYAGTIQVWNNKRKMPIWVQLRNKLSNICIKK